jgi:hypothetical protein
MPFRFLFASLCLLLLYVQFISAGDATLTSILDCVAESPQVRMVSDGPCGEVDDPHRHRPLCSFVCLAHWGARWSLLWSTESALSSVASKYRQDNAQMHSLLVARRMSVVILTQQHPVAAGGEGRHDPFIFVLFSTVPSDGRVFIVRCATPNRPVGINVGAVP